MIVSEIFPSMQGEGKTVGKPAVFLRLAGCNLNCRWCDSKYASQPSSEHQARMVDEVYEDIIGYPIKRLVVTGGEPLLQQKELRELLNRLNEHEIEVETNGSIASEIDELVTQYNVSPKLTNSGMKPYPLAIPPSPKVTYKFVIDVPEDVEEVRLFVKSYQIPENQVYLMPQGVTKDELLKKEMWLAGMAQKSGYNFTQREHILLWGNVRGR